MDKNKPNPKQPLKNTSDQEALDLFTHALEETTCPDETREKAE